MDKSYTAKTLDEYVDTFARDAARVFELFEYTWYLPRDNGSDFGSHSIPTADDIKAELLNMISDLESSDAEEIGFGRLRVKRESDKTWSVLYEFSMCITPPYWPSEQGR